MSKLYPPIIEGTIPAFYGTTLVVPFSMNPAVSFSEIGDMRIQIRTIQNQSIRLVDSSYNVEFTNSQVIFNFSEESAQATFNIGQYYKIQIAYQDKSGIVGFYSTVGVIKYTTQPKVFIEDLEESIKNIHKYSYVGVYQTEDKTEKVYSYKFNLFDNNDNLIKTSGELIHNNTINTELGQSYDEFDFNNDLIENKSYYIQYIITTMNGLIKSSPKYLISQKKGINSLLQANLNATTNPENGCIELNLNTDNSVIGDFSIIRSSEKDDFMEWNELYNFRFQSQIPHAITWNDFNIEHGVKYRYAIQQFNSYGIKSNKLISVDIVAELEHSYLYDGEKQLKIKFNPKVSSFKDTMLETKTNTIGSKYPFIFKNGNVKYKEFPIAGLISYQTDEDFLFVNNNQNDFSVNLTYENIAREKDFKLTVLDWLNDGKPKLFKSATEGNYIVRLLNSSLSPTDQLGRMLHTFSTTASEIADYTYDNLLKYGIAQIRKPDYTNINWETIDIATGLDSDGYVVAGLGKEVLSIQIEDATPGDLILFVDNVDRGDINSSNNSYTDSDSNSIEEDTDDGVDDSHENTWVNGVGATTKGFIIEIDKDGKYYINLSDNPVITSIRFIDTAINHKGKLTIGYNNLEKTKFDLITNYTIKTESYSFDGPCNVIDEIENDNITIQKINYIYATLLNNSVGADTTINFNDRVIDIRDIKEYKMYSLDRVNSLTCGNGVKLDIMCDIQEVVYKEES